MTAAALKSTEDQIKALPADALYEIVNGEVIEIEHLGFLGSSFASVLIFFINAFAMPRRLGLAIAEGLYQFRADLPQRRPDVSFVPFSRWPANMTLDFDPPTGSTVPSLAVEIISPSNTAAEIEKKRLEYFEAGVTSVWVVFPTQRTIHLYDSPNESRVIVCGGMLTGGKAIPGFSVSMDELFSSLTPSVGDPKNGTP